MQSKFEIVGMSFDGIETVRDEFRKVDVIHHKFVGRQPASAAQVALARQSLCNLILKLYPIGQYNTSLVVSANGTCQTFTADMRILEGRVQVNVVAAFHPHSFTAVVVEISPYE